MFFKLKKGSKFEWCSKELKRILSPFLKLIPLITMLIALVAPSQKTISSGFEFRKLAIFSLDFSYKSVVLFDSVLNAL